SRQTCRGRDAFQRGPARGVEADWLFDLGTPRWQRTERDVSGAQLHGERRSTIVRAAAADSRFDGAGQASPADPRRLRRVRGARGNCELSAASAHAIWGGCPRLVIDAARTYWITG